VADTAAEHAFAVTVAPSHRRGTWLERLRGAGRLVLYPLLAAAYPIVAIYALNLREMIPLHQIWPPLALTLVVSGAVLVMLRLAFGDWHRAGLMTSVLVALFFVYGPAWEAVRDVVVAGHATLLVTWVLGAGLAGALIARLRRRTAASATPVLNLVAVALVVGNLVAIGRFQLDVGADVDQAGSSTPTGAATPEQRPDVYWIVLDRYGSREVIDAYYGHDISPFLDQLRERGFYVAEHATANYLKTAHSLVSARNMDYLDPEALRQRASADDDWGPLYRDLSRSFRLLEVLRSHDYRFVYLGTYWDFTATHPEADINHVYDEARSEFARAVSDHTMLLAFEALAGDEAATDRRRERWNLTRFQWDRLHDSIGVGSPKFVHAHFSLPHGPYVFHADGSFVTERTERERSTEENYVDQVEYANARVLEWVDALLAADPDNPPIVVVQSEEGPWPHRYRVSEASFRWAEDATDEELHQKFGVLSAFHLPGLPGEQALEAGLSPSISLVNQWRQILNHFFGTDYERLPDRNFIWPRQDDIYTFIEVTERVNRMPRDGEGPGTGHDAAKDRG
jgi:hypothetical protein